ncbi:hypothetical protein [Aquimarina algiphila]|uniref:hypothetical protein n=1 Tax=Aquimarina algiphila TaxID=2047982 RepID=UPI0024933C4C|nr:hypothetical protein [Aquimarina algiphila]
MNTNTLKYLLIILSFLGISCTKEIKNQNKDNSIVITKEDKTVETPERTSDIINSEYTQEESIYIGMLQKMYGEDDYYISIAFNDAVPDSFHNTFHRNIEDYIGELISKTEDHERYKIKKSVAQKYFDVRGLDTIIILNDDQERIDTLFRKNYEYFSDQLESQVIATYEKTKIINKDEDYLCMSNNDIVLSKTSVFKKDSTYLAKTLIKNSFHPSNVYAHYKMIKNTDTISFVSFGIYNNKIQKECFYLFKNKNPIDSIINEYSISKMLPVPISMETENLYIAYEFIPDTDAFWTSLIGIDLKNDKLKNYKSNRLYTSLKKE